jgi:hypothetical protein
MPASAFPCFNVRDHGATGDGATLDTAALNAAIAACHAAGGGTVFVPAGTYLTGTVDLLSHVTLHLDAGSTLKGSPNLVDYRVLTRASELRNTTLIRAEGVHHIAITGRGTIDGNADAFALYGQADTYRDFDAKETRQGDAYFAVNDLPDDGPVAHKPRPGILILIVDCREILVADVHIVNAPNWCLHLACSSDAVLTGIDFKSSLLMPNSDGFDVSLCRNVRISNCRIETGDDGMAFSPCADGFGSGLTENITVENCVISARSCAIRVGWGLNNFRNLTFSNIVIRDSHRGIGIFLRYGETIENLLFSNITIETRLYKGKWWGKGEPIHISALAEFKDNAQPRRLRNVTFSNILATGDHGIVLHADANSRIENVTFDNVRVTLRPGPLQESFGGNYDYRPVWDPRQRVFAHEIPAFHADGVSALTLRNFSVDWIGPLPAFVRHAVEIERFDDVVIDGFRGRQAATGGRDPAIVLRNGRQAVVRHSTLTPGANELLGAENVTGLSADPARRLAAP